MDDGTTGTSPSAESLLETVSNLIYREGAHPTGLRAAISDSGVSRKTLHEQFGTENMLIEEALKHRFENRLAEIEERLAELDDPSERLRALVEIHAGTVALPWFSLCPLVKAAVEQPELDCARQLAGEFKARIRDLMMAAGSSAGLEDPAGLARGLVMLIEGCSIMAYVDDRETAQDDLRRAASKLISSHTPSRSAG